MGLFNTGAIMYHRMDWKESCVTYAKKLSRYSHKNTEDTSIKAYNSTKIRTRYVSLAKKRSDAHKLQHGGRFSHSHGSHDAL
jgi:hypothetical protein